MKHIVIALLLTGSLGFAACNDQGHSGHDHDHPHEVATVSPAMGDIPAAAQVHIDALAAGYLEIQQALSDDDSDKARDAADRLSRLAVVPDSSGFTEEQLKAYEQHIGSIQAGINTLAAAEGIEAQRQAFDGLSANMYELVKTFGTSEPVYQIHCSMAFDGKGAMWLNSSDEVTNPYYGANMYSCGSVEEVVKK